MSLPSSLPSPLPSSSLAPSGFQPYRPSLPMPPYPYHPGLSLPPGYPSLPPEADPLYQASVARYMSLMSRPMYPSPAILPPHYYPGGHQELAMVQEQMMQEELRRRGELEAIKEAELRAGRPMPSPSSPRPPSSSEALHRLSRIAGAPGDLRQGKAPLPPHIKLPTKPLDFSQLQPGTAARPLTVGSSPSPPSSPAPPSPPSASRCLPYTPKPRPRDRASVTAMSTPKKLFVRPFEDDYSPIKEEGEQEQEVKVEVKKEPGDVSLEDIVRPEEQEDSDYESMSSDSSIKKEGDKGLVCPSTGHVLTDEEGEKKDGGEFLKPDPDLPGYQKDKLKYLRYFRLVTHRKKNDIEIQKLEKRKSRLRERSPSPPPGLEEELGRCSSPCLPLPSVPPHLNRLPESHAKAMYLHAIGLCRASEEQKGAHEVIWGTVLEDRLGRDRDSAISKYFVRLRAMTEQGRGVKRNWSGAMLGPGEQEQPAPALRTQLVIPSCEALSRLSGELEPRVSLPSSVEINLCSLQPIAKPSLLLQEVKQEPGSGGLHSTTSYQPPTSAPPAHLQHLGFPRVLSPFTRGSDGAAQEPEDLSQPGKRRRQVSPLPWPGVEAVTEAYQRWRQGETNYLLIERRKKIERVFKSFLVKGYQNI